jgi:transcriptional regulator with XRE-family HTH domain
MGGCLAGDESIFPDSELSVRKIDIMGAKLGTSRGATENADPFEQTAAAVLRALRGKRSQRALARVLGYRANPITDWEHGRRFPTAVEALRAAHVLGVDVVAAFSDFHTAPPPVSDKTGHFTLALWLTAIRGTTPIAHLAARADCSRFAMARWLSGAAQPRLPDFFRCVDAVTGRLPDLVAGLVPIESVPSLLPRYQSMQASKRLAFDAPWTEAVLRVLEVEDYRRLNEHDDHVVALRHGIPDDVARDALRRLEAAAVIRQENGLWRQDRPLSVDTRGAKEQLNALLRHWSALGYRRITARKPRDLFSYNVMSCSHADYERIRELLRRTFREMQSIVAASEPTERVALLNLQLLEL